MSWMDEDETPEVEEKIEIDPFMPLMKKIHLLKTGLADNEKATRDDIMNEITEHAMTPYYEHLCDNLGWPKDMKLVESMRQKNEQKIKELEAKKKDAEENLGDTEVRDVEIEMVNHFHRIGDKQKCCEKIDEVAQEKTLGKGAHLDLLFIKIRLGFTFEDVSLIKDNIAKASDILKAESDWERRNRLKVYEGIFNISIRNFNTAIEHMLDSIATFSCYELMDYTSFIYYTNFVCLPILSRPDLKKKILENSEVLAVMNEIPTIQLLVNSIYDCAYDKVLDALEVVCEEMRRNPILAPHTNFYFREVRILVFKQYLASYRSVGLNNMADAFKLTPQLLDAQLCCFISANRLSCKIDKVTNQVITERADKKNANYQELIEKGDLLLNRVTKLARVIGA
eukprot:TRINITY_DN63172_c0_g2_i1.p2 TRINITY_DN63172_c0_g2~~TRINITY_DN63172_c0_g2_i1.p2  ORF type:complete len:412 (-),score=58.25 TRINITY_DN63172_c0_g2_i1:2124-3311(-)